MDPRLLIAHQQQKKRRRPTKSIKSPRPEQESHKQIKISPSQAIGYAYEEKAIDFLQAQGLILLARNLRCPLGEIDAVMREGKFLVFIEIRHRSQQRFGGAIASITPTKLMRLRRAALFFLPQLKRRFFSNNTPLCRFDAVIFEEEGTKPIWLKHITL